RSPACPPRRSRSCSSPAAKPKPRALASVQDDPAKLDDRSNEVGGGPVGNLAGGRDVPDHEIGGLAALKRADRLAEPDRVSRLDRRRDEGFVRGQPEGQAGDS